jgi:hypothetical protein
MVNSDLTPSASYDPKDLVGTWTLVSVVTEMDGRARISCKPSRREGRSDPRLYLWFTRSRKFSLRGSPGCSGHPAFPAPSAFRG